MTRALRAAEAVSEVSAWLLEPARGSLTLTALHEAWVNKLLEVGIPAWRSSTSASTMHPEVLVQNSVWRRGAGAILRPRAHDIVHTPAWQASPVAVLRAGGLSELRCRLVGEDKDLRFPVCAELAEEGGTDYVIFRLPFSDGPGSIFSLATDDEGGFTDEHIGALRGMIPAAALRLEQLSSRFATESLLHTYLGKNAASRVLRGEFKRGEGQPIDAVIWLSDLRGFTSLVDGTSIEDVLTTLDRYFACVAEPVEEHGGEVLKLIGDAVLAIFTLPEGPEASARAALAAAERAFRNATEENEARRTRGQAPIEFGVALHAGRVMYGNIGARERLDFTVIGAAVNEVSRVEGLCKQLSPLLFTARVATLAGRDDVVPLGEHALRGVQQKVSLFTLLGPRGAFELRSPSP